MEQTILIEEEEDEMNDDRRRGLTVSIPGLRRVPAWYRPVRRHEKVSVRARRQATAEEEEECGTEEECEEGFLIAEVIAILIALVSIGVCVMACQATSQAHDRLQRMSACSCVVYTVMGLTFIGILETAALLGDHLIHEPGDVVELVIGLRPCCYH